nr:sialin-like [Penaeus vannamei]
MHVCSPAPAPPSGGALAWDESTQGLLLGSYFYGYIVTNIAGGRAAERLGGRKVFGLGVVLSAVLTLLSPVSATTSTALFVAVRMLVGAASGVVFPAMNALLSLWIPPSDRAKFSTVVFAGLDFGKMVALPVTGWLCASGTLGGWPLVFYVFGGVSLLCGALWFLLVSDCPEAHPRISQQERDYLVRRCGRRPGNNGPIPWKGMMTSLPVWSLIIAHVGHNWGSYTLITQLPTYLKNIYQFDIQSNGLLSAFPYLTMWVFSMGYSGFMHKVSHRISVLSVRRISMAVAAYGPMCGLLTLCIVDLSAAMTVAVLCAVVGISGAMYSGYMCSHQDLAPNYAGTLFGITNTLANIPGFAAPQLTGAITEGNQTVSAWRSVFLISSAVYFISGTAYLLFISADKQPWNDASPGTKGEEELGVVAEKTKSLDD